MVHRLHHTGQHTVTCLFITMIIYRRAIVLHGVWSRVLWPVSGHVYPQQQQRQWPVSRVQEDSATWHFTSHLPLDMFQFTVMCHRFAVEAQALRLQASPLPALAAWALASSQPRTLKYVFYSFNSNCQRVKYDVQCDLR